MELLTTDLSVITFSHHASHSRGKRDKLLGADGRHAKDFCGARQTKKFAYGNLMLITT